MNEAVLTYDHAAGRRRREAARRRAQRRRRCNLLLYAAMTVCIVLMVCTVHSGSADSPATIPIDDTETMLTGEPSETVMQTETDAPPATAAVEATPEWEYLGEFRITHYCACQRCCGKSPDDPLYGITATGTVATEGRTIAVDPSVIPYGSMVAVEYDDGRTCYYIAEDCGGAIKGRKVDVFIADHERAKELGVVSGSVWVLSEE